MNKHFIINVISVKFCTFVHFPGSWRFSGQVEQNFDLVLPAMIVHSTEYLCDLKIDLFKYLNRNKVSWCQVYVVDGSYPETKISQ